MNDHLSWLSALDLDPTSSWLRMGTRRLGDRPWLVTDSNRPAELTLRAELIKTRPREVLAEPESALDAARELEAVVEAADVKIVHGSTPLRRLGRSIQEDLCLLERTERGWVLRAAVLCFPSRWKLLDKLDRTLGGIHEPVQGYEAALDAGVTRLIDGLGEKVALRRNWFLHPDGSLFQPQRPAEEPLVPAARCGDGVFVRSERQTLRLLPETDWCVFTIRIQHCTVAELAGSRGVELRRWLEETSPETRAHRGVPTGQATELLAWLDDPLM